jgi:hypothetical protein
MSVGIGDLLNAIAALKKQLAPLPQTAAGAGQWKWKVAASGATLSLDAGGTWAYLVLVRQDSSGYVWWVDIIASVAAGGIVLSSPGAGFTAGALVYETQDFYGTDFSKPILFDTANNGYMVTMPNGQPFEILESNQTAWLEVQKWLAQGNTAQPYVPPAPVPPDPVMQANATLNEMVLQDLHDRMVGPNPPKNAAAFLAAWKAAGMP